ncbi:MAG: 5-demethoxyubiquinol-8 5-hydroxylase UbiM [bacterium]
MKILTTSIMDYDIVIVGSGPAGLSLATSLADSNLQVLILEKQGLEYIADPKPDGREIALTHTSQTILESLGVWNLINSENISTISSAKVLDEGEADILDFESKNQDKLGYLVSNYQIRAGLYEKVKNLKNVDIITECEVKSIKNTENDVIVNLRDKQVFAKLLVAADSRFSTLRRQAGINTQMRDFSKTMIVVNVAIETPHGGVALERFDYDKTIALLPMNGNKASFVLTVDNNTASRWLSLENDEFGKRVSELFDFEFGNMTQIGERHFYPLMGVFANSFVTKRFALLGDAAVGMHPVTAHGFNLGLKGADILATQIKKAAKNGIDIGDNYVLKRYEREHILLSKVIYFGTNIVIDIFTGKTPVKKFIRSSAIKVANFLPPVKKAIVHHLTSVKQI